MTTPDAYSILREYLGGSETFTFPADYEDFARGVVQDYEAADELLADVLKYGTVLANEDSEYIERYTLMP